MTTKGVYFRVGVFVLAAMALIVAAVFAFGVGLGSQRQATTVETYLDASVQGLEAGSKVRNQGVEVGRVKRITFVDAIVTIPACVSRVTLERIVGNQVRMGEGRQRKTKKEKMKIAQMFYEHPEVNAAIYLEKVGNNWLQVQRNDNKVKKKLTKIWQDTKPVISGV